MNSFKLQRLFLASTGVLFALTGVLKLTALLKVSGVQSLADPIFSISFKNLVALAAVLEILVAIAAFRSRPVIAARMVLALCLVFLSYRTAIWANGWKLPCPCLGSLPAGLGRNAPDMIAISILIYCAIGAFIILVRDLAEEDADISNVRPQPGST